MLNRRTRVMVCALMFAAFSTAPAQEHAMRGMLPGPLGISMDRMGSGTTWIPDAVMLPSHHTMAGSWELMTHGFAFGQYDWQSGPRGDQQLALQNWAMLMASRATSQGRGRFQARAMLSLDPLTVTKRGYPLLLQTGETYNGSRLVDRQHPHDFWMELAALYEWEVTKSLALLAYAGPVGEPALGPVAFMHRPSAMDDPAAPLGHHWEDATHITFGVVTAGVYGRRWRLEGSHFNGREPDEERWNFDPIRLDSWSGRLTVNPTARWSATFGYGFLDSPELLEPGVSVHRLTASILRGAKLGAEGQWSTAAVWGANVKDGAWTHAALLESEAVLDTRNGVLGRVEVVRKSAEDLALPAAFAAGETFNVGSLSLGYIREFARMFGASAGIGLLGIVNVVPSTLTSTYGSRTPGGAFVFLRLKPFHRAEQDDMHMEHMP